MTSSKDPTVPSWRVEKRRDLDVLNQWFPWGAWRVDAKSETRRSFPTQPQAVRHADREARRHG